MSFLSSIFGDVSTRIVSEAQPMIKRVNDLEPEIAALSDEALREKTALFREKLTDGVLLDNLLPEAFAAVREAAKRALGLRHFDEQLIGGYILHRGGIAEMRTGEGKTLVATLPAYLNALTGKGVHVVTVNDYLSRRDGVWMGEVYARLGLSVGVINHESSFIYDPSHTELDTERDITGSFHVVHEFLRPVSRREAYAADITYGTNNEFGFDYLRNNLVYDPAQLTQRSYNFAIVDEIDSILIDEARTPLIIAGPIGESEGLYATFAKIAERLERDTHFVVDEKFKQVTLTDAGIDRAEEILGVGNIYTEEGIKSVHHLETAVKAKALYERDKEYVVRDDEVIIVDEFTGRMQPGRRWSEGLHQAIEAKEGVKVQKESRTYASITFQNYFRLYTKLSGMTGTALTSSEEFYKVYGLETYAVPTHVPIQRLDHQDQIFQTETGKLKAVARQVKELNAKGQPVLVGTVSIEKNELLSAYLSQVGVRHEMLNAKNHEREGEIIAQAGRKGAVTIATNMAGRGVDIKLGGNPATQAEYEEVKAVGGLFVLGTERHEARRIDNQLRGRSGRQGDPGETQFFVSLEDNLMRVFASDTIKAMFGRFGIPEDQPIENSMITNSLESAQGKIEGFNFDSRKNVLEYDDVLNHQRTAVYRRRQALLLGDNALLEAELGAIADASADPEELRKHAAHKREVLGDEVFFGTIRRLLLQTIDTFWVEHLEMMDYMRGSVNLRAYGQRDPLIEYKREGLRLFKELQVSINETVARLIPAIGENTPMAAELKQMESLEKNVVEVGGSAHSTDVATENASRAGGTFGAGALHFSGQNSSNEKIGRNDPCPCGSGKKWKACGLLSTEEHQRLMAEST